MLGRTCGVTRSDRIRNENVQQNLQVAPIEEKMTECSLRWYEHEHKRPESSPVRHVEELHVKGIGQGGRPVKTLIVLKKDSMESWILELTWLQIRLSEKVELTELTLNRWDNPSMMMTIHTVDVGAKHY